jgi:transposase InsO family protein
VGGRGRRHGREQRELIVAAVEEARRNGARLHAACAVAGISGRTVERWKKGPAQDLRCGPKHAPANALSSAEVTAVLEVLRSPENVAVSPKQLVPRLADAGIYLASESTMYRLRRRHGLRATCRSADRSGVTRSTATHAATGPNQVWSWDITYLPTTIRGRFLYLYVVIDVWSRRIVGWAVHERESADHAAALIRNVCVESGVDSAGLVLHSDNGKPMRGSTMLAMLQWLGIVPSFSRPHVSNDNPYSESLFRTLKQTPAYPSLPFAGAGTARTWVTRFIAWYNTEHRHSGIRYVTPDQRHRGEEHRILARRAEIYEAARRRRPGRWTRRARDWTPILAVTLNPVLPRFENAA